MKKLLIATHNPAKKNEITKWFHELVPGVITVSLDDLKITDEPEETGRTFAENSLIKAKYYAEKSGLPSLADDGGIEIDALNGAPGVLSSRWLGYKATDEQLIRGTLEKMSNVPMEQRTARLTICLTHYDPRTKKTLSETESIEGYITTEPDKTFEHGFPYRAIFKITKYDKFYHHLTPAEHNDINHRKKAVKRLIEKLI